MKLNIELLNHFSCDFCQSWWSIASLHFHICQTITCPYCSKENKITEISGIGNLEYSSRRSQASALPEESASEGKEWKLKIDRFVPEDSRTITN